MHGSSGSKGFDRVVDDCSAGREKAAPKSRLQVAPLLLALLGGLGRLAGARLVRCRVVDLADVVGLDRKRLVLHAVSRVRPSLDLAFNNYQRPSLEGGGGLRERSQA